MKYFSEEKRDDRLPYEMTLTGVKCNEPLPTADVVLAVERRSPKSKSESAFPDYSEEAIPERDPAYHLPVGTDYAERTVGVVPAEVRLDLARRLQQLGMNPGRAAAVASL